MRGSTCTQPHTLMAIQIDAAINPGNSGKSVWGGRGRQYVHAASHLMAIQIDAAINPGNSGERVGGGGGRGRAGGETGEGLRDMKLVGCR